MSTASSSPTGSHDITWSGATAARSVCWLDEAGAGDPAATGAKAAALARAAAAGLPVLDGFAITTTATRSLSGTLPNAPVPAAIRTAWEELSGGGERPLVVRSSSTAEDLSGSSMAGRFTSRIGVEGWPAFLEAVDDVLRSGRALPGTEAQRMAPMAALVQPLLDAVVGGVVFGVDPVTGRSDRTVVAVAAGAPSALVSGEVDGDRYELDLAGRVRRHVSGSGGVTLPARRRRAVAALGNRTAALFGGPQDVEWAIDGAGALWLLQSRPVTTEVTGVPSGPVLGPGPVAETFPDPLSPLEEDLWVPPLRRALRTVFELVGTAAAASVDASPLVVAVDGRVAVESRSLCPRWQDLRARARTSGQRRFVSGFTSPRSVSICSLRTCSDTVCCSVTVSVARRTRSTGTASFATTGTSFCRTTSCSSSEIAGPSVALGMFASVIGSRVTVASSRVTGTVWVTCSVTIRLRRRARPASTRSVPTRSRSSDRVIASSVVGPEVS